MIAERFVGLQTGLELARRKRCRKSLLPRLLLHADAVFHDEAAGLVALTPAVGMDAEIVEYLALPDDHARAGLEVGNVVRVVLQNAVDLRRPAT